MGKTAIAPRESFTNQQLNSVVVKEGAWRNYLFLNLRRRKSEIFHLGSSGSTMPIINKSSFGGLNLVFPTKELLVSFDTTVGNALKSVLDNDSQSWTLSKLRDTLLPKLLSGELRIPDAEKFIKDAKL